MEWDTHERRDTSDGKFSPNCKVITGSLIRLLSWPSIFMPMKIHFHAGENPVSCGGKSSFVGGNRKSPPRNGQTLRNFEIFLSKFHFILPNFYIPPPWRMFVFQPAICRFLRRDHHSPPRSDNFSRFLPLLLQRFFASGAWSVVIIGANYYLCHC